MPNGALLWQMVADQYQRESGEEEVCNADDIKKHWHNNLCNKMCKPTGRTGGYGLHPPVQSYSR